MTDKPILSKSGQQALDARLKRQAEALRANLARRKARGRAAQSPVDNPEPTGEPPDSKARPGKPGGA